MTIWGAYYVLGCFYDYSEERYVALGIAKRRKREYNNFVVWVADTYF